MRHERLHDALEHLIIFSVASMSVDEVQVCYLFLEAALGNELALLLQAQGDLNTVVLGGPDSSTCLIGHPKATMANTWSQL